jgi:motility quorum-sensing regulator/GCU-specific mRNA interferase toxin
MLPSSDRGSRPTYDLEEVQRLVGQGPISCRVTETALYGARALGLGYSHVVEAVLSLAPGDFHKSMPADRIPGMWQDVYHLTYAGLNVYVKVQLTHSGEAVVIQFKKR